jgi:hypothetical protein
MSEQQGNDTNKMHQNENLREETGFWLVFEHAVNRSIPLLVILLAAVLILDNPLWKIYDLDRYETAMIIFSVTIFFFFFCDLVFKWKKVRNIGKFVRLYWIDILAVFPFYLGFRAYSAIAYLFFEGEDITKTVQVLAREESIIRERKIIEELKGARPILKILKTIQSLVKIWINRLYLAHVHVKEMSRHHKSVGVNWKTP